jgi:hypothetical protein
MRRLAALIIGSVLVIGVATPAAAKTKTRHELTRYAVAQWLTIEELPGAQRITVWFLGASIGRHGSSSDLFYERDLCVADQACVVEDYRSGFIERLGAKAFQIDRGEGRAKLDATYDLYTYGPTGEPLGPATPTHVTASWTAVGTLDRSSYTSRTQTHCSETREAGSDASRRARATGTANTTKLGTATEARIGRFTYSSYEKTC